MQDNKDSLMQEDIQKVGMRKDDAKDRVMFEMDSGSFSDSHPQNSH